jgi:hypothetical protein
MQAHRPAANAAAAAGHLDVALAHLTLAHAALALRHLAAGRAGAGQTYGLAQLGALAGELDDAARALGATRGHGIEGGNFTMRLVGASAALRFFAAGHARPERADMPFHADKLRQLADELDQAVELLQVQDELERAARKPWQGHGVTGLPAAPQVSADLHAVLAQVRAALQRANETGAIVDTIWISPTETLFDFLDARLAAPPPAATVPGSAGNGT